jgi:hypothetical protein
MGKRIITKLYEFIMTQPSTIPTVDPDIEQDPDIETPVKPIKPVEPARPYDPLTRPSIDPNPLARRKKDLENGMNKKKASDIGKKIAMTLVKRLEKLNELPK